MRRGEQDVEMEVDMESEKLEVDGKVYFKQPYTPKGLESSRFAHAIAQIVWLTALALICVTLAVIYIGGPDHELSKFISGRLTFNVSTLVECFKNPNQTLCQK